MVLASVALGSNLPDRVDHILAGVLGLASLSRSHLISVSTIHETQPVGPVAQGPYLNAAALIQTALDPEELLACLHDIERSQGRERETEVRWGPRTLDLDILTYGELSITSDILTVPHPRLLDRAFVLGPLSEIAPDLHIPNSNFTPLTAFEHLSGA